MQDVAAALWRKKGTIFACFCAGLVIASAVEVLIPPRYTGEAIIRFNFIGTLSVDALGVALAAFGYLNPLVAAFIHVASELTFILNSARLLPAVTPPVRRPPG